MEGESKANVVVHHEAKPNVVIGSDGDFGDGDEVEELLCERRETKRLREAERRKRSVAF